MVHGFLERQALSFQGEGALKVVSDYDFPLPVVWRQGRCLLTGPQDYLEQLAVLNGQCRREGGHQLAVTLLAQELPRNHRFRLWLRFDYLSDRGQQIARMDKTVFCRHRGHRLCVEMVEVTDLQGTAFAPQTQAQAAS